ncbi:hypothetical protein [Amnibacterium sp.]|uniref:hypothetical protein n=1 Tax=Amnibacterium sp. TaxID=1872496 RepID=UPI003F7BE8A7
MQVQDGTSVFGLIAVLAGGVVGALVRVVLAKAVPAPGRMLSWLSESGVGLVFGAVLAVAFISAAGGRGWSSSGLGGALTAYAGACATYAFLRAREALSNPLVAAVMHFLASIAVTGIGYAGVIALWAALR